MQPTPVNYYLELLGGLALPQTCEYMCGLWEAIAGMTPEC